MEREIESNKTLFVARAFKRFFQILLYIPIQAVFLPFAIIGLGFAVYKEIGRSRKLGISFSAIKALQYRWMMHYFDTRSDPLTVAFVKHFPCESHCGMFSVLGALIVSVRLSGFPDLLGKLVEPGEETPESTAGIRVLAFDRIMEKYVDEVEQIVIPGAGFDLVALRYTENKGIKVFELDQCDTLNIKVDTLKKAGVNHDWITYLPVDYASESWTERLQEAGFDRSRKTLFLWQSVSLYLDAEVVREALRSMADLCTEGSVVAQDFYSEEFSSGQYSESARRFLSVIEKMGEPAKFGIDMSKDPRIAVESFLRECGLEMTEYNQFGWKIGLKPFYCIVEAKKA